MHSFLMQIPQFIVSGLTNGSIYALIAFGFSLIENATGIVNFAQGDFVMLGAMFAIWSQKSLNLSYVTSFIAAVIFTAFVGVGLEKGPLRCARNRDILTLVMITIGASICLRGGAMLVWGKNVHSFPPIGGSTPLILGPAAVVPQVVWIIATCAFVVSALHLFFHKSLIGKAMRAAADNPKGALLIGISVQRMVALAFAMSGALGALAGLLITPLTSMSYSSGLMLGLKGFAAAILGGYGSTVGAVAGGFLLGILESLGAGFLSSTYKDAFAFVILLAILFVKPTGIFGQDRVKRL